MGDACEAQYNAARTVFPSAKYLMCYFQVMVNAKKRLKASRRARIMKAIQELHFVNSIGAFNAYVVDIYQAFQRSALESAFWNYFSTQWFGKFGNWQCFHSPSGFAKTTNPAETFNNQIKRDYTRRRLLALKDLIDGYLLKVCEHQSTVSVALSLKPQPTKQMIRAARLLFKHPSVIMRYVRRESIDVLLGRDRDCQSTSFVQVLLKSEDVFKDKESDETISCKADLHGSEVDVKNKVCGCKGFYKFGFWTHLLLALRFFEGNLDDLNSLELNVLYSRRHSAKLRRQGLALCLE